MFTYKKTNDEYHLRYSNTIEPQCLCPGICNDVVNLEGFYYLTTVVLLLEKIIIITVEKSFHINFWL